jgi:hypothetical protein
MELWCFGLDVLLFFGFENQRFLFCEKVGIDCDPRLSSTSSLSKQQVGSQYYNSRGELIWLIWCCRPGF